jgi:hypothetical protein
MKRVLVFAFALTACAPNFLGTGTDGGTSSTSDASTAQDSGATGAGCTNDLGGGVKLCTYISSCPQLGVDHDKFPDCGFRIRGDALDLECVCNGVLCPMGVPTSCAQATQLMNAQTEIGVCQQVAEDRCTTLQAPSNGGTTCDKNCESQCFGDSSCIKGCGC